MAFKQGKFIPTNKGKYIGNSDNIIFRSGWEQRIFMWCDISPAVKRWASEELVIPYFFPIDQKMHRYYPDLYLEIQTSIDGPVKKYIVEVKPKKDTEIYKPKVMTEKARRLQQESVITMLRNKAKWEAAEQWCKERGLQFIVVTEDDLFNKNK